MHDTAHSRHTDPPTDYPLIDGELRDAYRVELPFTGAGLDFRLSGRLYGDRKGRFMEGERVTTSRVTREDGDYFLTRNSAYQVTSWLERAP
jgi:hypothetical protein